MVHSINCPCIKNHFDVKVGWIDPKHITIIDASEWMDDKPEEYQISITGSEHNLTGTVNIKSLGTNILPTKEIYETYDKICIHDGFFCIKASSCGKNYTINRAYLANTECMIDRLYVRSKTDNEIAKINEYYNDIELIKRSTAAGMIKTAQNTFLSLSRKLELIGCNECGCK